MTQKNMSRLIGRVLRNANGERPANTTIRTISPVSHTLNSNVGIGQNPSLARRARTVGLYTDKKSVKASSVTCSASAIQNNTQDNPSRKYGDVSFTVGILRAIG